ncbi:hypothetical protein GCM10020295_39740 [Streptomyces cinereospinus]
MSPDTKDRLINLTLGTAAVFFTALAFTSSIFGGKEGKNQRNWIVAGVTSSAIAVYVGNSERVRLSAYRDRMKQLATQAERNYENLIANLAPNAAQAAVIADRTLASGERDVRRGAAGPVGRGGGSLRSVKGSGDFSTPGTPLLASSSWCPNGLLRPSPKSAVASLLTPHLS